MEENNKSGLGVSALVLGIISIISGLFYYMSWPTGIIAIVLGTKSIRKNGSKIGKAGLITGIIGLSISLFIYIGFALMVILSNIY